MPARRQRKAIPALVVFFTLACFTGGLAVASEAVPTRVAETPTTTAEHAVVETTTEEITTVVVTTVETPAATETPTTTGAGHELGPGGVAVVGAKATATQEQSSTQWGWIAFAILAGGVVIFGVVWLLWGRHKPA